MQEKILTSSFLQNNNPNDQVLVEPGPHLHDHVWIAI